jgi:hypothetical protein
LSHRRTTDAGDCPGEGGKAIGILIASRLRMAFGAASARWATSLTRPRSSADRAPARSERSPLAVLAYTPLTP